MISAIKLKMPFNSNYYLAFLLKLKIFNNIPKG